MTDFSTQTKQSEEQYSSEDYAFANAIIHDLKQNDRLPLMFTQSDVFHAIKVNLPLWYEKVTTATEDDILTFHTDVLNVPQKYLDAAGVDQRFRLHTHQVLMPPAVYGIYNLFYNEGGYVNRSLLNYANWSLEWLLLSSTFGAYPRLNVDTYMGTVFSLNLLNSLSKEPVKHTYNQNTHVLRIDDVGYRAGYITAEVARCVNVQALYGDPYFKLYIKYNVLNMRADHIELYDTQLPGDLRINIDVLRRRADNMKEQVDKYIEADQGADFYAIKS